MTVGAPARLTDLPTIEQALWAELEAAVQSGARGVPAHQRHPWRSPALATVGSDGSAQVRTVVLRDLNSELHQLVFYTDARSPKVAELRADPRGQLLCWSAVLGWQLRMHCSFEVHTTGLDVTARWAAISHTRAAQDYLAPLTPGTMARAADAAALPTADLTPSGFEPARPRHHFAVVEATVMQLDWLDLHPLGHRRASFSSGAAQWLIP